MKLSLYVLRIFLKSFVSVSSFVLVLVFLVDLIDQFAEFSAHGASIGKIVSFCVLRILDNFLLFLPLIILLSTILCFLGLARTSEIVIMRAVGIPATRFVFIPIFSVGVFGLLLVTILNPSFVKARALAQNFENTLFEQSDGLISLPVDSGTWLRTQNEDGVRFYRLDRVSLDNEAANHVTIYQQAKDGTITEVNAKRAQFDKNNWTLKEANRVIYGSPIEKEQFATLNIPANRDFEAFFSDYFSPKFVNNRNLPQYINELEDDGYDTNPARSYFYQQLVFPLSLMTLCLVGAVFALAPQRMGGVTQRIFLAITAGFLVFGLARVSESLGVAGSLPIWLSVIAIPMPAFFICLSILLKQEDG